MPSKASERPLGARGLVSKGQNSPVPSEWPLPGTIGHQSLGNQFCGTECQAIVVVDLIPVPLSRGAEFASGRGIMARTVTLRLEKDAYDELQEAATAERRPLANLIETAALARIREAQFVDDGEMAEILGDDALVRRLKAGSQQARHRKGDFVA